jgi:hypothetical protein
MLSLHVLHAIVDEDSAILQRQAVEFGDLMFAANLCLALINDNTDDLITAAMDKLETTSSNILNQYVATQNSHTVVGYWSRSPQPSPLPCADAATHASELGAELRAARDEIAIATARIAAERAHADQLNAENQSFRRSRLLRLGRVVRRVLGLPYHR